LGALALIIPFVEEGAFSEPDASDSIPTIGA
jgi:hypothetical protein